MDITRHCAFTLAEVLITLGIVGVVAAITIPNLVANYQKKRTVTALKTAYSIFSQAIESSKQEHGDISMWDNTLSSAEFSTKYILPYVENLGILNKSYNIYGSRPDVGNYSVLWSTKGIYILKNGMTFSANPIVYKNILTVDINGAKGPNKMGRDGFVFKISPENNQLILFGAEHPREILTGEKSAYFYNCTKDKPLINIHYSGSFCGALIMHDGWQIARDYPW